MKISICIPFHWMEDWEFFFNRCLKSIESQTYKNYEIILVKHSTMPVTSNRAIQSATGNLIKVLYMDDYLAHEDSLQQIAESFTEETKWLVTGCYHDDGETISNYHAPSYSQNIHTGNNSIGSPSVLTMRRGSHLLFDEELSWLLDCDLYKRLYEAHGLPQILNEPNVIIGLGKHQTTHLLSDTKKLDEHSYLQAKYGK